MEQVFGASTAQFWILGFSGFAPSPPFKFSHFLNFHKFTPITAAWVNGNRGHDLPPRAPSQANALLQPDAVRETQFVGVTALSVFPPPRRPPSN